MIDVDRVGRDTAWLRSADLGPVRFVDSPSDQRLVVEHGDEDDDIRQMCATALIGRVGDERSEEHTSELQSLMRISYAVICLKKTIEHRKKHRMAEKRQAYNKKKVR